MQQLPIDIIIPVYNAYEDLQQCVASVLHNTSSTHRIILIDDCSPDDRIADYFEKLAESKDPRLTLLSNESNLGFVGTVNRGMSLGTNDVLLLNSDTIVTSRWLEKIAQCAWSDQRIGTITPFSNNAEICSFPEFCRENPLPPGLDAEGVNRVIESSAIPTYPDIPTAVGFCMYIRRTLLNDIGMFDAVTFRLGYGEENDFCRRAVQGGWRNVLCDDTFIQHVGNSSFDLKKQELATENLQRLLEKHPDYQEVVSAFITRDPIKPIRDLALSQMTLMGERGDRFGILHIMHGSTGGTEQHIQQLMTSEEEKFRHYMLVAVDDIWHLKDANTGSVLNYKFVRQQDQLWAEFLREICASFRINLCHVHHIAHCRPGLLAALGEIDVPYGVSVHDFYFACPTVNLLDAEGIYCGAETARSKCENCLKAQSHFSDIDVGTWRSQHEKLINRANFVIAPSQSAADTFNRYFPRASMQVIPHGFEVLEGDCGELHELTLPDDDKHNVGILGAIGPVKGARMIEYLARRSQERDLPLRWVIVGYMDNQFEQYRSEDTLWLVHGEYEPQQMPALLDHYDIELVVVSFCGTGDLLLYTE